MTLDLNSWWSVPQYAPRIVRVPQMSILSRHLVMMKSIICPCRERGCIQVVLCASFRLNMVLVTIRSNSVHSVNRISPLELHFPIPYLSKAEGHLSFSLPILFCSLLSAGACRYRGCFWVYPSADCRMSPCSPRGLPLLEFYAVTIVAFRSLVRGILIVIILSLTRCVISVSFATMSLLLQSLLQLLSSHRLVCHSNRRYTLDRLDFQTHETCFT